MTELVQEFRLGQRVQTPGGHSFDIHFISLRGGRVEYSGPHNQWYLAIELTLAPVPPPYVPSERRVLGRAVTIARFQPELYRCETDAELAARHAVEQNQYNRELLEGSFEP